MRFKKMIAAVAAACMMFATCTTAFAAENTSWKNYDYSKYVNNWSSGSGSSGSSNTSGWNWAADPDGELGLVPDGIGAMDPIGTGVIGEAIPILEPAKMKS